MKLFLVIAASWLYQNIVADFNPKLGPNTPQPDDTRYTKKQRECFFNPHTSEDCGDSSRGVDKTVEKWYAYWAPNEKKYKVPMFVDTGSYSSAMLPKLWESLNWAKDQFDEHTNIELVFIDEWQTKNQFTKGYIKPFYGGNCWSYLGNLSAKSRMKYQQMDIGWCYNIPGSILHETMHALGWVHEHMRSDRDRYVDVSSSNAANCRKYVKGRLDTSDTPYDLGSIMHYPEGACGIQVRDSRKSHLVGNRKNFSKLDIEEINHHYPETGPLRD